MYPRRPMSGKYAPAQALPMKTYVADLKVAKNLAQRRRRRRDGDAPVPSLSVRHLRVLAHIRTLTMTSGLPDPAEIAEARTLGGIPQHNGALRFIGLLYTQSRRGTVYVERWGGWKWTREKPRPTGINSWIYCVFSELIRSPIYWRRGVAPLLQLSMWD